MPKKLEQMEKGQQREDKDRAKERGLFTLTREEKRELLLLPSAPWWEVRGEVKSDSSPTSLLCHCFSNQLLFCFGGKQTKRPSCPMAPSSQR